VLARRLFNVSAISAPRFLVGMTTSITIVTYSSPDTEVGEAQGA